MKRPTLALLVLVCSVGLAHAWWVGGHERIAEAAAAALPDEMPAFFRAAGKTLAHYSGDPDRWKNPAARQLRAAEAPDHFLDLEDLAGKELPADRYQAVALLYELKQKPERTGMLPYAVMENYDRLTVAFYDYREAKKAGGDLKAVEAKCLVYAGVLSHFTGDLAMPLHTTRDYDGKRMADGKVEQKGIHARIDAFPEKQGLTMDEIARGLKPQKLDDVWKHVVEAIQESHTHVENCYRLDRDGAFERATEESTTFIRERCRVGAQLTLDLWYNAWLRSATLPKHY